MTYDSDVLIVGAGPVGLSLALLLESYSHRVTVLERQAAIYPLPRAVMLSHENVRLYDGLGLHDALFQDAVSDIRGTVSDEVEIVGACGQVMQRASSNGPSTSGSSKQFALHQPSLERVLETACKERNIDIARSTEVVDVTDMHSHVEVSTKGPGGARRTWSARFVVGCDGANSTVRRCVGIPLTDCPGPKSSWVVVDVTPKYEGGGEKFGDFFTARLYMDPRRPRISPSVTPQRRRWEFMLMSDEEIAKATDPAFIWSLLAEFGCNPDNANIEKSAAYTLRGGWCETFNHGRILLAGDAAHISPPFYGQGLNSGLRDVYLLAWRLSLALRYPHSAWDRMFHDWSVERLGPTRNLIKASVAIETRVTMTDLEQAKARDAQTAPRATRNFNLEQLGSPGMYFPRSKADVTYSDVLGSLFVDGQIAIGDKTGRLCDHFGARGWLILERRAESTDDKIPMCSEVATLFSEAFHGKRLAIGQDDVQDTTGAFLEWFQKYGAKAVLLRPDHFVYGIAKTDADLESLVRRAAQYAGLSN